MSLATPDKIRTLQRKLYAKDVYHGMKPIGEPDAGNLHVRFDERRGETE